MAKNLATLVTRKQVVDALEHIISTGITLRHSTGYDLVYKNQRFPPKDVVRKAAELAGIQDIGAYRLNGGDPTNKPLEALDFTIVRKNANIQPTMRPNNFLLRLTDYLQSQHLETAFGPFRFKGRDNQTTFGTPAGGWNPADYPAFVFGDGRRTYLVRLAITPSAAYIVLETAHRPGQLRNFNLVEGQTFRNENGTVYLYENYRMTAGGGAVTKPPRVEP